PLPPTWASIPALLPTGWGPVAGVARTPTGKLSVSADAVARRAPGAVFVGRSAGGLVFANRRSRCRTWEATAPPPGARLAGVRLDTGPRIPSEPAGWLRTPFD